MIDNDDDDNDDGVDDDDDNNDSKMSIALYFNHQIQWMWSKYIFIFEAVDLRIVL